MSPLWYAVSVYFGIGICYALYASFAVEKRHGVQDFTSLLVAATGSAVWWPVVLIAFVREVWKRVDRDE